MEFVTLKEEVFTSFAEHHPCGSFHQTEGWAKLKAKNGWNYYFVGVKEKDKVLGASMLLEKKVFGKLSLLYAPRGFLIDYHDEALLRFFTQGIREFAKNHHAIFVKLDPYLICQERDINGYVIPNGIDNRSVIEMMKKLGYHHTGFPLYFENMQPRWAFALDLKGKSKEQVLGEMESKTRQLIRKNTRSFVTTREIKEEELSIFKDIMDHTSERRNFIDRPYTYYKNMLETMKEHTKILIAEIDFKKYFDSLTKEIEEEEESIKAKEKDISDGIKAINIDKTKKKIEEAKETIKRLEKKRVEVEAKMNEHGNKVVLGGIIFMLYGKEILSLFGGAYEAFMEYLSPYTTNWNMIEYAITHGYEKYNFYGITGDFQNKKDELYGLYDFKRGFGGHVEEYIGEFDYIVKPFWYRLYHIAFSIYGKLKK